MRVAVGPDNNFLRYSFYGSFLHLYIKAIEY